MENLFYGNNNDWQTPPMNARLQSLSSCTTGIIPSNHDITNECFLNQGRTEDQEDWWRMICVELKKSYTQIQGTTMTTVKLSFMSK